MKSSSHLICAHPVGADVQPTSSIDSIPADFRPLRLVQQPGKLILVLSQSRIVLGRHSLADVRLMLPYVSRRHCLFEFDHGQWRVTDLGSLNGMLVNDCQIESIIIHHGDRLGIGGLTFVAQMNADAANHPDPDTLIFEIHDSKPSLQPGLSGQYRIAG